MLAEILELHRKIIEHFGSAAGVRDLGSLELTIAQPQMKFDRKNLYQIIAEKIFCLAEKLSFSAHQFSFG